MIKTLFLLGLLLSSQCFAKQNLMRALYMADKPGYKVDEELSMIGEFGFLVTGGNTKTSTITAKINTSQELTAWSYQVIGDALYKQSKRQVEGLQVKSTSAQKLFVSGQLDYKLTQPDNRVFIYGEYEDKRFSGFSYQAALAAGWSSRLWHDESSEFKYSVGPGYAISEVEKDSSNDDRKSIIVRAAMEYKRKFSDQATFRQFISTEADQEFTKTKSETSLSTKLNGSLAMKLSFVMNHDTSVNASREELDTETAVTLVYQFF